ncbi:hypothetical protein FEA34_11700 [Mannheimia haemolytica]|nr:hypothetical protein BG543_03385 [Mannheimia haemolytica]QEA92904.1 hypothetical protein BG558_03375 [Mannheimia haemolytica]QEB44658.1 hypothetical protein BG559_03395 [Mannheimia haemolytica]QEB52221.1 hypothetical protein BG545_03380 [Mannheimia haemolytica]QEB71979.1 hypothetical protein BG573_03665 [Mannheimia haemolytica]
MARSYGRFAKNVVKRPLVFLKIFSYQSQIAETVATFMNQISLLETIIAPFLAKFDRLLNFSYNSSF